MYSKTPPATGHLSSRQKRTFGIVGAAVILVLVGLGVWGALAHDNLGGSAHGCVNVTVPSSTGGSTLHYCGATARAFCQKEFTASDQLSKFARPQCVLAGLGPSSSAEP
jgi:hypothetical protein